MAYYALTFPQFQAALDRLTHIHTSQLTDLKWLLEQMQTALAAQLHALQATLRLLCTTLEQECKAACESALGRDHECLSIATQHADYDSSDWDATHTLCGDSRGNFNDTDVHKAIHGLRMGDRMHLCMFRLASHSLYAHCLLQCWHHP